LSHRKLESREPSRWLSSKRLIFTSCALLSAQALLIATLGHRPPGPLLSEATQLVLGVICVLACTEAFRRSRGVVRYAWQLLAVAFVIWVVAQALGVYLDFSGDHTLDNLDGIMFFFSVIPFGLLTFLDPDGEPSHFDRLHLLDFVQVCIFWFSIFLCFSPSMWSTDSAFRLGHFTWSRSIAFDSLLVATFVLRAVLTKSAAVRSLFGRMAIFLLLSGMADSYALNPGQDLEAGGWFDLVWSALLAIPILITATWKSGDEGQAEGSTKSQRIVVNQIFPLLYPLVTFFILARVDRAYPIISPMVFGLAFLTFAARVLIIQRRQGESETKLLLDVAQRKRTEEALRQSEVQYRLLFDRNALPMWVFDRETLKFLAVNEAAIRHYGFSEGEFLKMTLRDIRPDEDMPALLKATANRIHGVQQSTIWRHKKKNGAIIDVEVVSHELDFHGIDAELVAAHDITDRKRSEAMLQDSENKYRVLFEDSADATWLMDENGFLDCNSAGLQLFGYSADAPMLHPADISPPNQPDGTPSLAAAKQRIASAFRNGKERFEWLHQRKDGTLFTAEVCLTALTLSGRLRLLATVRDITQRKQAEEGLLFKTALLEAQAETTIDGILAVDETDHIVLANKQFGLHFGLPDELMSVLDDLVVRKYVADQVEDPEAFVERIGYLNCHRDEKSRDELRLKNGKIFDRYSAPLVDSKARYRGRIWYFRDITDRKVAEKQVQYLAYYDALTGLPNRSLLQDRLAAALAGARRRKDKVALLFLDLDRFKIINDSLGHSLGDLLLQEVAERLRKWAREQDTIARLGGDEFLIVLTDIKDIPGAAIAAERLMDALTAEFVIQGHSLSLSCSLGISIYPEHGADGETLIKNADAAMYSAKDHGRNSFRFFTDDMNVQAVERLTLENGLRLSLEKRELFLVYQPQMEIATGRIIGLEALLRWKHPELGLVPPDRFIRIAENSGLIVQIGEWVLRTACSQARRWQDEGLLAVPIAVNVSAVQFRQEGFCELVKKVLRETGLASKYLELELTESLLLSNADVMFSVFRELKAMGVKLAIDDFGTGYSSLSYLKQFPVSKLKIDRSFVRDVAVSADDRAITTAIIRMAKSLNLRVIAEGVENEAQMTFLRTHQCDEIQGYYFCKPLPVDELAEKLRCNSLELHIPARTNGARA
jgi:diguanylate cyclase (GGDEF)-like protein/PAS domain S-box-containing protein